MMGFVHAFPTHFVTAWFIRQVATMSTQSRFNLPQCIWAVTITLSFDHSPPGFLLFSLGSADPPTVAAPLGIFVGAA